MKIMKHRRKDNDYAIMEMSKGKILAIWDVFRQKKEKGCLNSVEYDVFILLDRFVQETFPMWHKIKNAKFGG